MSAKLPRAVTPLAVLMNGRRVGSLLRRSTGDVEFVYDADWLAWERAMPVSTSMPLREDRYIGEPAIAVFDNLLPDSGRVRAVLAGRKWARGADVFGLLSAIGRDCVGALQFAPVDEVAPQPEGVEGTPMAPAEVGRMIADLRTEPLGLNDSDDFRASISGAQDKAALLWHEGQWLKPNGTTPTSHIIKPAIGRAGAVDMSESVENEHLCARMLNSFGVQVARTEIADFDGVKALVVERFDRRFTRDGRLIRLPQEDFCQALGVPSTLKYQNEGGPSALDCLGLLNRSDDPFADQRGFLKAVIMFWLMAATDGHAKNFSLFLLPGGRFHMAPLYDVISVQPNIDAGELQAQRVKLSMSAGDRNHYRIDKIAPRHFGQTASRAGMNPDIVDSIFEEIERDFDAAWSTTIGSLPPGFQMAIADSIMAGMKRRLALWRLG